MTDFYTKHELPFRLALFWLSADICSILASFLAFGVLRMRGLHGRAGWRYVPSLRRPLCSPSQQTSHTSHRWLFLIEGLITLTIGISTFFMMPPSPTQTKSWFRPNGWFTEREEVIATTRILRDDPTKGDMHNREGLTPKRIWLALWDYDMWPLYIMCVTPPRFSNAEGFLICSVCLSLWVLLCVVGCCLASQLHHQLNT